MMILNHLSLMAKMVDSGKERTSTSFRICEIMYVEPHRREETNHMQVWVSFNKQLIWAHTTDLSKSWKMLLRPSSCALLSSLEECQTWNIVASPFELIKGRAGLWLTVVVTICIYKHVYVFCAELFKETGILKLLLYKPRMYAADIR